MCLRRFFVITDLFFVSLNELFNRTTLSSFQVNNRPRRVVLQVYNKMTGELFFPSEPRCRIIYDRRKFLSILSVRWRLKSRQAPFFFIYITPYARVVVRRTKN